MHFTFNYGILKRSNLQNFNEKWSKILYFYQITYLLQIVRLHVAIGDRQLHPPDQSRIPISAPDMLHSNNYIETIMKESLSK